MTRFGPRRLAQAIAAAGMLVLAACASGKDTLHSTLFLTEVYQLDPAKPSQGGWVKGYTQVVPNEYAIDEWVRAGETIDNWSELVTMQNLRRSVVLPGTPQKMMEGLRTAMLKRCPGTRWEVVEEDANSILYEWSFAACPGQTYDQYELARIIYGKFNIWRLAYTTKAAGLDPAARSTWLARLREVRVTTTQT